MITGKPSYTILRYIKRKLKYAALHSTALNYTIASYSKVQRSDRGVYRLSTLLGLWSSGSAEVNTDKDRTYSYTLPLH